MDRWRISSPSWTLSWFKVYKGQMEGETVSRLLEEFGCRDSEKTGTNRQIEG